MATPLKIRAFLQGYAILIHIWLFQEWIEVFFQILDSLLYNFHAYLICEKVLKSIIKGLALIIFRQLSNQPSAHVPFIIWVLCFLPSNDPKAWYLLMINKKVNSYWEENFIQKNWDGVSCQVLEPQLSTKQRCISLFVGRWCCSEKRQCLSVLVRNSLTAFQNFSVLRILNFGISDESFITTPLSLRDFQSWST